MIQEQKLDGILGPRQKGWQIWCLGFWFFMNQDSEERVYGIAVLENRNMNCLGKAGVTARPRECQCEVCGHVLKGSGWQGLVLSSSIHSCFSPVGQEEGVAV